MASRQLRRPLYRAVVFIVVALLGLGLSSPAKAAIALAPPPTVTLDSPQPAQSVLRSITVTPFNTPLWGQGSANSYDYGYTTDPAATRPDDTLGSPSVTSSDPADPPLTAPVHVVLDLSDRDPAVNLYLIANANMTGIFGEWSTPVLIYGPGDTPPPPNDDKQHGSVTSLSWSVSSQSKLWTLDVVANVQNVSCPATLVVTANGWTKRPEICGEGEIAPSEVRFGWKVFNANHKLPPDTNIDVSAFVDRSKEPNKGTFATSLHVPKAPVLVGVGDSYSSGHRQLTDEPRCALPQDAAAPCQPSAFQPNDPSYSWVSRLAQKLNDNAPFEWRYLLNLQARSGATTDDIFSQGQIDSMSVSLQQQGESWNVSTFSAGANNGNFSLALAQFYAKQNGISSVSPLAPWAVKKWGDCPDIQGIYNRLLDQAPNIKADLEELLRHGREASSSVRFVDMMYPYTLKLDNVCSEDRQIPINPTNPGQLGVWHGAKSVVDTLNEIHVRLVGADITHVDLRSVFGNNPLSKLQLTRNYGYPHPEDTGQEQMANRTARLLLHG